MNGEVDLCVSRAWTSSFSKQCIILRDLKVLFKNIKFETFYNFTKKSRNLKFHLNVAFMCSSYSRLQRAVFIPHPELSLKFIHSALAAADSCVWGGAAVLTWWDEECLALLQGAFVAFVHLIGEEHFTVTGRGPPSLVQRQVGGGGLDEEEDLFSLQPRIKQESAGWGGGEGGLEQHWFVTDWPSGRGTRRRPPHTRCGSRCSCPSHRSGSIWWLWAFPAERRRASSSPPKTAAAQCEDSPRCRSFCSHKHTL